MQLSVLNLFLWERSHLTESDKHIIDGLIAGDTGAYEYIYTRYYQKLCVFANRFIDDPDEVEEVVQKVIIKIWENREQLHSVKNISSYLYRSVQNTCLNFLKHLKVQKKYQDEASAQLKEIELEHTDIMILEENMTKIESLISMLPEQCRTALLLSKFEQCKNSEIAERMNISQKAVEMNVYRALKKLRELVKEHKVVVLILLILYFLT